MLFRTELPPLSFPFQLSHAEGLLSIGSCFTENIGTRLTDLKFRHLQNPFGIVYNPISIAGQLEMLLTNQQLTESDLFENQGLWHSWAHHGSFSGLHPAATLTKINTTLQEAQAFLPSVSRLLLTLGTAHVFAFKETGQIVANCHKMPGQVFAKRRLAVEEIVPAFQIVLQKMKAQKPDLQVIFTVSPVRHIRDGLVENQRSKATLLLAIDALCQQLDFVHYFPAYELIIDDLRDYRFFNADMIHPNELAIDYVWQYFSQAFFDKNTQQLLTQIEAILQASKHRAFHAQSAQHQAFIQQQLIKIERLEQQYPFLDFTSEKQLFQQQVQH
ncbi:MAG: GSCFA domain-containing protein [Saprospiraceae bacterium]